MANTPAKTRSCRRTATGLSPGIRRDTRLTPQPIITDQPRQHRADGDLPADRRGPGHRPGRDPRLPQPLERRAPQRGLLDADGAAGLPGRSPVLLRASLQRQLRPRATARSLRSYVDYKISESWHTFLEGSYVKANGYGIFQPAFSSAAGGGTMPVVLRGDNAFLNGGGSTAAALRAEWTAAGKTFVNTSTAQVGKFWQEFGGRDVKTEREQIPPRRRLPGQVPDLRPRRAHRRLRPVLAPGRHRPSPTTCRTSCACSRRPTPSPSAAKWSAAT